MSSKNRANPRINSRRNSIPWGAIPSGLAIRSGKTVRPGVILELIRCKEIWDLKRGRL